MTRRTMVKPDPSCLFMSFFLQVVAPILTNFILWKMTSKKSQEESRNYWPVNDPPEEKSSLPTFPIGFLRSTSIYALNAKLRSQSRIFDDDVDFDYPFSSGCFLGDFPLATKAFQVNQTRRDAKIWGLRGENQIIFWDFAKIDKHHLAPTGLTTTTSFMRVSTWSLKVIKWMARQRWCRWHQMASNAT